jgi:hypothetical protein
MLLGTTVYPREYHVMQQKTKYNQHLSIVAYLWKEMQIYDTELWAAVLTKILLKQMH